MSTKEIIKKALEYRQSYNFNFNALLNDFDIKIKAVDLESNIKGYTAFINGYNFIYINTNIDEYEKDYILAHEIGHILLHDNDIRAFNNYFNIQDKHELQANIFAVVFLDCIYRDDNGQQIQKIINKTLAYINTLDIRNILI